MVIDGYEGPVVAGEALLDLPGFWAAYLMYVCGGDEEHGDPSPEWFGADPADVDAAFEALSDEERWPAFRVPFGDGHTAVVVGRNFPDEAGIDYFVVHPEWDRHGFLATLDGHQAGPGLAWRELAHMARTPDTDAPGVHDVHARLLMLLPALGDDDLPDDAARTIAEALVRAGVPADHTPWLVECLLDHPLWDPAQWTLPGPSPLSGGVDPYAGIMVCDGPMSPRCGMRLAQGVSREHSDRLARALGTWAAG
ncbi:hypothetical protein [Streptomyces sp. NPDC001450]